MAMKAALSVLLLALAELIVVVGGYFTRCEAHGPGRGRVGGDRESWPNLDRGSAGLPAHAVRVSIALIAQRVLTAGVGVGVLLAGGGLLAVSFVMLASSVVGFRAAHRADGPAGGARPSPDRSLPLAGVVQSRRADRRRRSAERSARQGGPDADLVSVGRRKPRGRLLRRGIPAHRGHDVHRMVVLRRDAALVFLRGAREGNSLGATVSSWGPRRRPPCSCRWGWPSPCSRSRSSTSYTAASTRMPVAPAAFPRGDGYVSWASTRLPRCWSLPSERPRGFARAPGAVLCGNVALNVVLIPEYGASGAAFTAALSALVLCAAGFGLVRSHHRSDPVVRSLAGPAIAGAVASAVVVFAGLPTVAAATAGGRGVCGNLPCVRAAGVPRRPARVHVLVRRSGPPSDGEVEAAVTVERELGRP